MATSASGYLTGTMSTNTDKPYAAMPQTGYKPPPATNSPLDGISSAVTQLQDKINNTITSGINGIADKSGLKDIGVSTKKPYSTPRPETFPWEGGQQTSAKKLDYYMADLAQRYGMSKETAYQEALANTAYAREVQDMQNAGLNPAVMYSGHSSGGADGVRYVSSSGGGSGGGSRRRSGSSAKSNYIFSTGAYNGIAALAGTIGALATKKPSSYWTFSTAAKGLMSGINGLFGR